MVLEEVVLRLAMVDQSENKHVNCLLLVWCVCLGFNNSSAATFI